MTRPRARTLLCAALAILLQPGPPSLAQDATPAPESVPDGAKLARFHCGRCHVVTTGGGIGGIGSTPSFAALRAMEDWEARFDAFWTLPPHPSFTQVAGVTLPFDETRPPPIAPLLLTLEEVEAITRYAASIEAARLGAPVQSR